MGARIAAAALDLIGAPFRLHGRSAQTGLDCVGLVWLALRRAGIEATAPRGYSVRGYSDRDYGPGQASAPLPCRAADAGLVPLAGNSETRPGDVLLVRPAPVQSHLMVVTAPGLVHADAGLRRVALRPGTSCGWPVARRFRHIAATCGEK